MTDNTRRIPWIAAGLGGVAALLCLRLRGPAAALGVVAGTLLSLINFHWLRAGVEGLVETAVAGRVSHAGRRGMARFVLRYALLATALYGIFYSHLVPLAAVVLGLLAVSAAAVVEAVWQLAAGGDSDA